MRVLHAQNNLATKLDRVKLNTLIKIVPIAGRITCGTILMQEKGRTRLRLGSQFIMIMTAMDFTVFPFSFLKSASVPIYFQRIVSQI